MSQPRQSRVRQRTFDDHKSESYTDDVSSAVSSSSHSGSSEDEEEQSLLHKLPTLPDLRFEQSYLATIRGFMHEDEPANKKSSENGDHDDEKDDADQPDHHHKVSITKSKARDSHELWLGNLRVEWFPIMYVTVRDQLISPLVQGAVWGVAGVVFTQVRQYLAARAKPSPGKSIFGSRNRR